MTGTVCLQGGGEFSAACLPMDAELVQRAVGRVVVTALAGTVGRDYATATANGCRHYAAAGATDVLAAPDVREDPVAAEQALRSARLIVLPGGSPARLHQALTTTVLGQIVLDLLADDGVVMGASAGAMVLCSHLLLPDRGLEVAPGLGAVRPALVLPHWSGGRSDWVDRARGGTPKDTVLLGLPEESGLLIARGRVRAVGRSASSVGIDGGGDLAVGQEQAWG